MSVNSLDEQRLVELLLVGEVGVDYYGAEELAFCDNITELCESLSFDCQLVIEFRENAMKMHGITENYVNEVNSIPLQVGMHRML